MFLVSVNTLAMAVACARQHILQKGFYKSTATVHLVWKTGQKNKSVGEDGLNHPSGVEDGPKFSAVVEDVKMEDGRIP